jgi:hypothetical protein
LFIPLQASAFATISPADTGRGSSLLSTSRQIASAVGVAVLGAILFTGISARIAAAEVVSGANAESVHRSTLGAYHRTFLWVALLYAAGAIAALFVRDADAAATMGPRTAREQADSPRAAVEQTTAS